jgi:hypothetical protein
MKAKSNMNNDRISPKERNLLKGAIRRVFSRSELRRTALNRVKIEHSDPARPRVKTWYYCEHCGELFPQYLLNIDHVDPIVPVFTTLDRMTWDQVVDRIWCEIHNLQVLDLTCHKRKSKMESEERKKFKKELK